MIKCLNAKEEDVESDLFLAVQSLKVSAASRISGAHGNKCLKGRVIDLSPCCHFCVNETL